MKKPNRRTPRRKPQPRKRKFTITVEAQPMIVTYTPNYMTGAYPCGHFEFASPFDPPRRIPVSTTGYWSHFGPMDEVEAASSVEDYARLLAADCIEGKTRRRYSDREPTLFSLLDR